MLIDREIVLFFRRQSPHAPHQTGELVLGVGELGLVFYFDAHVRITFGGKIFVKRSQRYRHHRVPAKQTEEGALSRIYTDDLEQLPIDQHRFINRAFGRKKRIGDVIADHDNIGASPRFEFVKESPGCTINRRCYDEIRGGSENEDVVHLVAGIFNRSHETGCRHRNDQLRVRCRFDHPVQSLGVFSFDFFSIAVVPPIIHWLPRPLRNVENVVAEHCHTFIETDGYPVHGSTHQCDGDNADNNSKCRER